MRGTAGQIRSLRCFGPFHYVQVSLTTHSLTTHSPTLFGRRECCAVRLLASILIYWVPTRQACRVTNTIFVPVLGDVRPSDLLSEDEEKNSTRLYLLYLVLYNGIIAAAQGAAGISSAQPAQSVRRPSGRRNRLGLRRRRRRRAVRPIIFLGRSSRYR